MKPDVLAYHARHLDLVHPKDLQYRVTTIGVGAIGSHVARVLSQLGFRSFRLIDHDIVGPENIAGQFYRVSDIGRPKVEACRDNLRWFLPYLDITTEQRALARGDALDGIVVAGVDSMDARLQIWSCVRLNPEIALYVDGRTAGEEVHVHTTRPSYLEDAVRYDKTLVPNDQATHMPCALAGVPHAHAVIAGLMAGQIVRWVRQEPFAPRIIFFLRTLHLVASVP